MSPVSSSASLAQAYGVAMLGKAKDMAELEGKATLELLESATAAVAPQGTGTLVDDVA